jgi:DNA replication and repair protein RecF
VIDAERRQQVGAITEAIGRLGEAFRPAGSEIRLDYDPGWRGDDLAEALESGWRRDFDRGATHHGPHRADLVLYADDKPARERLSRGEQKLLAAALLLGQADILASRTLPLLLLDDLASEFDASKRHDVMAAGLRLGAQLWVTGTRAEDYLDEAAGEHAMFHVKQGEIHPV